jgi:SAM-dependent methyltransferase
MTNSLKNWLRKVGNFYTEALCRREFQAQTFGGLNERPVEYGFVFRQIARTCPNDVLDVGTGASALPQLMRTCGCLVTATDNVTDYWPRGMSNRHYHVIHDDIVSTQLPKERYDLITCISVLEHIVSHRQAVASMFSLLKPGGLLVLSFPYNESQYVGNVYSLPGSVGADKYRFVTQVYSRRQVDEWTSDNGAEIVEQEYWRFFTGEFWTLGQQICPPEKVGVVDQHHISCLLLQKKPIR